MKQAAIVFCCLLTLCHGLSTVAQNDLEIDNQQNRGGNEQKILSRKRRFLVFPTGSSFSVAVCMTVGVYGNPQFSIWSWGLNYGFAYNLPTNSSEFLHPHPDILVFPFVNDDDKPTTTTTTTETPPPDSHEAFADAHDDSHRRQFKSHPSWETQPMMHRRFRRDIYRNIEVIIDKMGHSGRDCVLRTLCESSLLFNNKRKKRTMIQELIKTVFTMPKSNVLPFEHPDLSIYDRAYRGASEDDAFCGQSFARCGFSLIQLMLGKYSEPPLTFM